MNLAKRKLDTRNKIMMGGLIVKAGLDDLHKLNKAALLGMLLEAKQKLDIADKTQKKELLQNYTNIGVKAFDNNSKVSS